MNVLKDLRARGHTVSSQDKNIHGRKSHDGGSAERMDHERIDHHLHHAAAAAHMHWAASEAQMGGPRIQDGEHFYIQGGGALLPHHMQVRSTVVTHTHTLARPHARRPVFANTLHSLARLLAP
jgi:hypothetical protein